MKKKLHAAIVGLGPVGQILVFLQEAGCTVSLLDKDEEKTKRIRENGIRLEGNYRKSAKFDLVCTSAAELCAAKPDVIILAVKIYHTPSAVEELANAGIADPFIICAQNGIDVETPVTRAFGEDRTFRMVVNFAGNLTAPDTVNVTFFNGPNYLASFDDSQPGFAEKFAALLTCVDLDTEPVTSFRLAAKVWEKTILNAALSALCGISGLTMQEAMAKPALVDIVEQLIEESVMVARAEEIFFGENFNKLCLRYLRNAGNHFPSLAVDMMNNRPTEIDYFNGQFVKYGRKHYLRTPLHFVFTNLVKAHAEERKFMRDHLLR